jgi:hypothetical protein
MVAEWWATLESSEKVFWGIALIFTVLFFIQFVLSLVGFDFSADSDGADSPQGYHLDGDFALLSTRSIIAFFTFFGWTGVLILHKGGSVWAAILGSALAGLAAMLLVAWLFWLFAKLTQSGNADIYQSLFHTAEVYIPIPGFRKGSGKVLIELNGGIREIEAITEGEPIQTGAKVKIVEIIDQHILVVYPIDTFDINEHFNEPPRLDS